MYRIYNYKKFNDLLDFKEKYYVSYAVRGPTVTLNKNCNCMNNTCDCKHQVYNTSTKSKCNCTQNYN